MGVLDSIIKYKAMEEERQLRDVQEIGGALQNMMQIKQQRELMAMEREKFELEKENTRSLIESRKDEGVFGKLKQVNEGLSFAKTTGNRKLFAQLSDIGNDYVNKEQGGSVSNTEGVVSVLDQPSLKTSGNILPTEGSGQLIETDPMTGKPTIRGIRQKDALDIEKSLAKEKGKVELKRETGQRMSEQNVALVGGAAKRAAQTIVDGYKEGSFGNVVNKKVSDMALAWGGQWGDKYPSAAAYSGQITEVVARQMPLLTQQGDKPGSVRLVATVFDRLVESWPPQKVGPLAAKRMITESVRNMLGFARAVRDGKITNEMVEDVPDSELKKLGDSIARDYFVDPKTNKFKIELTPEEKEEEKELLDQVLEPINNYISGKNPKLLELQDKLEENRRKQQLLQKGGG